MPEPGADSYPGVAVSFRSVSTSRWRWLIRGLGSLRARLSSNGSSADARLEVTVVNGSPEVASSPSQPDPPSPVRRKRRTSWRQSTGDIVDGFTLEPLAPEAVAARCPRCRTAYGAESLACLIQRNEGRCAACGSVQVSTRKRRSRQGAG